VAPRASAWALRSITCAGAAGIGLGTTIKYLRRKTSAAANNGLSTTIKYILNHMRVRIRTGLKPTCGPAK
jgi:hypothetical protein